MAQRGRGDDYRGRDPERLLLIPGSRGSSAKKRVPWHQKQHAGCLVLAVLSLFGLGAVLLPSFESPGNITVFRAAEADVRVRQLAGWREDLEAPAPDARHAVTLAIKQDREAILAALATTSDPDSPRYGQHYSLEEVAAISTPKRAVLSVRAFVEKATSEMGAARVSWSPGQDYVRVEARVEDLYKIFNAKFRRWERRLRGEVVHETYRTRELAVPKDLEAHLDGFLGALHLPSGQLQHSDAEEDAQIVDAREGGGGSGDDGGSRAESTTEDPARTGTPSQERAAGQTEYSYVVGGVAPSAYSDRAPVLIRKPPRRVRVSERDWVLREAQLLADEAKASSRGVSADGKTGSVPKAFRVKVSADADEDVLVSVPAETGSETAERVRGERYVDETPAHLAVDKALSRVQASARYRYGVSESKTAEDGASEDERVPSSSGVEGSGTREGSGTSALRRVLSEEDEDVAAEDTTVNDDASASSASASRRASAARKAAERKRRKSQSARARGELEDKANAMFQKLDDEMREMKSFMAEVVHKDVIDGVDDDDENGDPEDEEDVLDRSGDGEADVGAADPVESLAEETKTRRDENADVAASEDEEDAPLPVVEAGSEAAKRAAKRVSLSGEAVNPITVPDDFWTSPTSDRGGVNSPGSESHESYALPSAPATSAARGSEPEEADAFLSEESLLEGDGGGYYEYELNYDAEAAEAEWSEKTYALEAAQGRTSVATRASSSREKSESLPSALYLFEGESSAARSKRASQVEERLKALVTPDKVLGYYNVPRMVRQRHPGATMGVAAFAGDVKRLRQTVWKYAQYLNVSAGAVRAVEQTDALVDYDALVENASRDQNSSVGVGDVLGSNANAFLSPPTPGEERRDLSQRAAAFSSRGGDATLSSAPREISTEVSTDAVFESGSSTLGRVSPSFGHSSSSPRRVGARAPAASTKSTKSSPSFNPSKTEKMEAAAQSAVASAVSGAVDAAVDAAAKLAEGVGFSVEKGDESGVTERAERGGSSSGSVSSKSRNRASDADGDLLAFRGDAEVAASAKTKAATGVPALRNENENDATPRAFDSFDPRSVAAIEKASRKVSSHASVSDETPTSTRLDAPLTASDMGWHDLASSRLESNLDVQAATATARGGEVDLFLASPSQHYGWEALDVVLNLAARRDPPSVMSLTFGGMEQPRVNRPDDRPDETYQTEMARGGGGDDFGGSATATNDDYAAERAKNRGGPVARLGAESPGANASVSEALESSTSERVSAGVSSARVPKPSASARGLEDANKPRPSYVKEVDAWNLLERVDTELAKLGLRGVTVVAASGDNGPFSFGIPNPYQAWSSPDTPCSFQPSFPGSMPHVVAVGGTTGGKDPFKPERAAAVESGGKITSGGGFSNVFPQPEWQKLAVQRYLKQYSYDLPPESFFNQSNRAYPDVAFAAEDIAVVFADIRRDDDDAAEEAEAASRASSSGIGGESTKHRLDLPPASDDALARRARHYLTESSGTSYAAPLFAGMIALVNDERLRMNKTTVGFVAPALYALHRSDGAAVFNDIKEGSSKCPNAKMCGAMVGCCKHGFRAGKGWDPLTGLGSVDFQRMRDELVRLP